MTYCYKDMAGLSAGELYFWIMVDRTQEQLGVKDIVGVFSIVAGLNIVNTRAKFMGTTRGTSIASVVSRRALNFELKRKVLPTITLASAKSMKVLLTKNIGKFVGRAVPVVGWIIMAYDVEEIVRKTTSEYNSIVSAADQCHD